jgi:uncharacterized membrane protein
MATKPPSGLPAFLIPRARLYIALVFGVAAFAVLSLPGIPSWLSAASLKPALAWAATTIVYLVATITMMLRSEQGHIRARAEAVDIGLWEIVAIVALAGAFSLFSVGFVLETGKNLHGIDRVLHFGVGALTVFLSWIALHVIYAVHYAHLYYDPAEQKAAGKVRGGLDFPGTKEPDYWDFFYFSLVIGMTCQVSDVQITARHMRHLVTAQGVIAFFYNTVVVAIAVNLVAGAG